MTKTTTIDLSSWVQQFGLLTAEWWDEDSKFVVVRGSTEKKDLEDFALRLDLDKRAFLDHAKNPKTDKLVQSQATLISQLVWKARAQEPRGGTTTSA